MGVLLNKIIQEIENIAPKRLAEEWDNVGLMVGAENSLINRVMCALDVTVDVLDKATAEKVDLIISHHPFIFKGIKNIKMSDPMGSMIFKAIKNNINIYSAHTNLDFSDFGLNKYLLKKLGINNFENLLDYMPEDIYKIVVFVPIANLNEVREVMTKNGAGFMGNYRDCTFSANGTGTFLPLEGTNPHIGKQGILEEVNEVRLETIIKKNDLNQVIDKMIKVHPYEEVAYDIYKLENKMKVYGYGKIGILDKVVKFEEFIKFLKSSLNIPNVRVVKGLKEDIKRIGVFTGSLDDKIINKIYNKIDLLITGDLKYHMALDIKKVGLNVVDAGHYKTEAIVSGLMGDLIKNKFKEIEIIENNVESDPFYFL